MNALLVVLGALVGAPLRYLTDRAVQSRHDSVFPWGTLMVNIIGCLILGCVLGSHLAPAWITLLGTGFCGTYTTYSTFGYETFRLVEQRDRLFALMNVTVSLIAGIGAFLTGYATAAALLG
ncbi:fluoride efflux transporter CrcB [Nocardia sp. NPDC058058]|uniref:fluoride efflux transporter CrcB n=1 Tax=Nocardia sp. NPDC058058 TaxID=3346317 RepID=UPI0036D9CF33